MSDSTLLLATPVCVLVHHGYDESMGAFTYAFFWDGEKVTEQGGMYSDLAYDAYKVTATTEQIKAAAEWYNVNHVDTNSFTYLGCVVKLKRSRKAPNNTPLKVVDYEAVGYVNGYRTSAQVCVLVDDSRVWVNHSTVDSVVTGKPVWWGDNMGIEPLTQDDEATPVVDEEEGQGIQIDCASVLDEVVSVADEVMAHIASNAYIKGDYTKTAIIAWSKIAALGNDWKHVEQIESIYNTAKLNY